MIHRWLSITALAALLPAQQTKVLPKGMDLVEGPSVFQYPFGTVNHGIQMLVDADQITAGVAVIQGMRFRPTQQTQTTTGWTRNYTVTAYTVAMNAQTFSLLSSPYDPNLVLGGATPTVVFSGPLTLPATAPLTLTPASFSIQIPFSTPYVFDASLGNLALMVELNDTAPPVTCRVDAVQFRNTGTTTVPTGIVAPIDTAGCVVSGTSMTSATTDTLAILGGAVQTQLTASPPGAFPAAFVALGFDRGNTDLGFLGLQPGCFARINGSFLDTIAIAGPGGFAPVVWNIPFDPNLLGAGAITQSVGLAPSLLLSDSVVTNAEAIRVGDSVLPTPKTNCGFHTVSGATNAWFKGVVGEFSPVIQLDGTFP